MMEDGITRLAVRLSDEIERRERAEQRLADFKHDIGTLIALDSVVTAERENRERHAT